MDALPVDEVITRVVSCSDKSIAMEVLESLQPAGETFRGSGGSWWSGCFSQGYGWLLGLSIQRILRRR